MSYERTNQLLENLNIAADSRSALAAEAPELHFYGCGTCGVAGEECDCPAAPAGVDPICGTHFYGTDICEKLPVKWAVCPVCDGNGTHVNPSIDANGITAEDFADDPDFAEDYMRGAYDQTCNHCNGRTTVPVTDEDACDPVLLQLYREQVQDEADDRACHLAELRVGA